MTNQEASYRKCSAHARLSASGEEGRHFGRDSWLTCYIVVFEFGMTGGYSGRKLFVGGLPPKVDDKALHDVFSRFWHIEEGLYSIV